MTEIQTLTAKLQLSRAWPAVGLVCAHALFAQAVPQRVDAVMPRGQNLRDRPEQATDVVLTVDSDGRYFLNGIGLEASQIGPRLSGAFANQTGDRVLYVRADARLDFGRLQRLTRLVAQSGVCVASMIGAQEPGTVSLVRTDAGQSDSPLRRAIDWQLPPQTPLSRAIARDTRIVLEVLPGPTYRINSSSVAVANLATRLREIFDPRPVKVLFVTGDSATPFNDVFHAMDIARGAGVIVIRATDEGQSIPARLPDIDLSVRVTARDTTAVRCRHDGVEAYSSSASAGAGSDVYFEFQVETPVKPAAGVVPRYPDALRTAHVSGEVLMQFVVNTDGRVDSASARAIRSSHELFTQAVRAILPDLRFVPATIGHQPVRQLVQMPFAFSVTP